MAVNVPVRSVTPATATGSTNGNAITGLPAPVHSDWVKQDISGKGAGRLESGRMLKKRKGMADRLDIEWQNLTRAETAFVLQTFDHEYMYIEYLDAKAGTWVSKYFYGGDQYASGWDPNDDCWESVKVSIIRSIPDSIPDPG